MTELDPKRVTLTSRALAGLLAVVLVSSAPSAATAQQVEIGEGVVAAGPNVPPRDARPATGRSTIRGRVLVADSGEPMRRAMVVIRANELRVPRSTLTDADGRYEFRDLPAGRYSINASKATLSAGLTGRRSHQVRASRSCSPTTRRLTVSTLRCPAAR